MNSDGKDMANDESSVDSYDALVDLALRDPKQARLRICELLDSDSDTLDAVLDRMSAPGEGRLRHIVANAVRTRQDKTRVITHLIKWSATETDEFAKRAIVAALDDVDRSAFQAPRTGTLADPALVETYRYALERLSHKMRNALEAPYAELTRLRELNQGYKDPKIRSEAAELISRLEDGLARAGRVVQFQPEDEWFRMRRVNLADWLYQHNGRYGETFRRVELDLAPTEVGHRVHIRASDHLLDTIFWNLWRNSQQAAGVNCRITVRLELGNRFVTLTIADNGAGFTDEEAELAFLERFSGRHGHGRGLLEVQAAVDDLHGTVGVTSVHGSCFVVIKLPLESP